MHCKISAFFIGLAFIVSCSAPDSQIPQNVADFRRADDERAVWAAKKAYVFGYPLVYSHAIKNFMTDISVDASNKPINVISHYPLADYKFRIFPYPDPQTYYSFVWLDVSKEPILFEILASSNSDFILFDAWTNAVLKSIDFKDNWKTLNFAVSNRKWNGILPENFFLYASKNIRTNAPRIKIYPLSSYDKKHKQSKNLPAKNLPAKDLPAKDLPAKNLPAKNLPAKNLPADVWPAKQIQNMPIEDFFNALNLLTLNNRPFEKDAQTLETLLSISVSPGMRFEPSSFSNEVLEKIKLIPSEFIKKSDGKKNDISWKRMQTPPKENADYYLRAKTAFQNIDGMLDAKAVRMISETDSDGIPFDSSANKYVLRLQKNQIPKGKWSLSAYDADGFLMKNRLNRYFVDENIKKNADGSIIVHIQKNPPSKNKESNWLPVVRKSFKLLFKSYPENESFKDPILPAVEKIKIK